ncbi:NAD(+) diphosphatase [Cellulomonas sp. URHE0023]|uniref:NAD(+) diphosphatase n=1 Tax=Cellulomonas sp. URHE0023 TaxID=1380354 RepID=UPI000B340A6E
MIPSDDLPLSRADVDRAAHRRADPDVVENALRASSTRIVLVRGGSVGATPEGSIAFRSAAEVADLPHADESEPEADWLLLGEDPQGATYLARRVPEPEPLPLAGEPSDVLVHGRAAAEPVGWASLRVLGATLDGAEAGLATTAVALDAWHDRHVRCPRCGAATRVRQAGWIRVCVVDGSEHYPRTDPAVIMAVVDDADRILLGHAAQWAPGRWSTLAGFVESGESLEHAVRREVLEETGVVVGDVAYRGSQPWPFPASLMLGFRAVALTSDIVVDGVELGDARWFTRDELATAVASGEVIPPGRASIARALIEDWFGGPL